MKICQILDLNLTYIKVKYIILNDLDAKSELDNTLNILQNFSYLFSENSSFRVISRNYLVKNFS